MARKHKFPLRLATFGLVGDGLVGTLLQVTFGVLLARRMTDVGFGQFSAARGIMTWTMLLATLGLGAFAIRVLPTLISRGRFERVRGFMRFSEHAVIGTGAALVALLLLAHALVPHPRVTQLVDFAAIVVFLPIAALASFYESATAAFGGALRAATVTRMFAPGVALLALLADQMLVSFSISVREAGILWGLSLLIGCLRGHQVLRAWTPTELRHGAAVYRRRLWVRGAFPYLGTTVALVWLDTCGIIVSAWFLSDATQAAHFTAAAQISSVAVVLGVATAPLYLPRIARGVDHGKWRYVRAMKWRRDRVMYPVILLAILILLGFGTQLLGLYGESYRVAYGTLVVLVLGKSITTVFALAVPQLQYHGKNRLAVVILASFSVIALVSMFVLGRSNGIVGIAIGQAGSLAAGVLTVQFVVFNIQRRMMSRAGS